MYIITGKEMQRLEQYCFDEIGMASIAFMERAGLSVFEEIKKRCNKEKSFLVICGPGNNGGDGYVIARMLYLSGYDVKILSPMDPNGLKGDAHRNYNICRHLMPECLIDSIRWEDALKASDVVVDAMFGTGLSRDLGSPFIEIVLALNKMEKMVYSVDIPSGINGTTSQVMNSAVKASYTIALQMPKWGNILFPGASYCGSLLIADIGFPIRLLKINDPGELITRSLCLTRLLPRRKDGHKGHFGKAILIAGGEGTEGAAALSALAAMRSGLGLLKVALPETANNILKAIVPEAMSIILPGQDGVQSIEGVETIMKHVGWSTVIGIGPGCHVTYVLTEILRRLLGEYMHPMVLDADALNILAEHPEFLDHHKCDIVMTPHAMEMARLANLTLETVSAEPVQVARKYAIQHQVHVVLKGPRTIIALPNGKVYVNTCGNDGMATAGSGDVLTGLITSLIGQGMTAASACIIGVYIHSKGADLKIASYGRHGLIARDIIEGVVMTLKDLVEEKEV